MLAQANLGIRPATLMVSNKMIASANAMVDLSALHLDVNDLRITKYPIVLQSNPVPAAYDP